MKQEAMIQSLTLANPWWEGGSIPKKYQFPYKRPQLKKIMDYQKLGRIVVVKGPRRTGKTTLLYQYIDILLKKGVPAKSILFASMDDLNLRVPLQQIINAHKIITEYDITSKGAYIFLDEIQFLENWSFMVKVLTDREDGIHLVVSGSSASLLKKGSESLAGRTVEETLLPFTPSEILAMRNSKKALSIFRQLGRNRPGDLKDLRYNPKYAQYESELRLNSRKYLERGGFPHLFGVKEKTVWLDLLRTDVVQKAIYKDLAELYSIRNPVILEKLFFYFIEATAGIANLSSISSQVKISRETLSLYIGYLKNSYFLFSLPKYSRYPKEILKSQEKIHIIDPALQWLARRPSKSSLLESVVASLLYRYNKNCKLYYWRQNYEVDCVVDTSEELLPFEVKDSEGAPSKSDLRGLINFTEKYGCKTGFVVYNGTPFEQEIGGTAIRFLPVWFFLHIL